MGLTQWMVKVRRRNGHGSKVCASFRVCEIELEREKEREREREKERRIKKSLKTPND